MEKCIICGQGIPEGRQVCPTCEGHAGRWVKVDLTDNFNRSVGGLDDHDKMLVALLVNNPGLYRLKMSGAKAIVTDGQNEIHFHEMSHRLFYGLIDCMRDSQ